MECAQHRETGVVGEGLEWLFFVFQTIGLWGELAGRSVGQIVLWIYSL